jgi:hypothetical protein
MRTRIATAAVVAIAVLLLNVGGITGRERIAAYGDNAYTMYPLRVEVARQWLEGHVPLWNPYQRAGAPLLADAFSAALYPGNFPFLLYPGEPRYRALELVAVLHYVVAALFMFAFLANLELALPACAFGALVYAGNGSLTWLTSLYIEAQNAAVWLPLILLALRRAAAGGSFRTWTAVGAVAVALQALAGQPEYSLTSVLIAGAFALTLAPTRGSGRGRAIAAFLTVWILGAALAAVQLLPTAELAAIASRGFRVSLAQFLSAPVSPQALLGWAVPGVAVALPHPYLSVGTAYLGAMTVPLMVEGIRGFDRRRVFFTALLVLGCLLAIGPFSPFGRLTYALPVVSAFRYPYKHLFEVTFAAATLAAIGADALLLRRRGSKATLIIATAAVLAVLSWFLGHGPWGALVHRGALSAGWPPALDPAWRTLMAAIGVLVVFPLVLAERRTTAVMVAFVMTWLSYAGNRGDVLAHASWDDVRDPPARALLDALRSTAGSIPSRYALMVGPRDVFTNYRQEFLTANYPSEFRIPAIHGCCPLLWAPLAQALSMSDLGVFALPVWTFSAMNRTLDVLACRFVGAARTSPYAVAPGRVVWQDATFAVTERRASLPAVRFVDEAQCATPQDVNRLLRGEASDPARLALVDCENRAPLPAKTAPAAQTAFEVRDHGPGVWRLTARVSDAVPGFLVLSQSDLPGWHATIDSRAVPIYRTYGLVQGIVVPPGEHDVAVEYRPASVMYGTVLSLAALGVVIAALGSRVVARTRRRSGMASRRPSSRRDA